jgi:hypothetical protein
MRQKMTPKQKVLKKCPRAYLKISPYGLCAVYQGTAAQYNDWLATADTPRQAWAAAAEKL